jgi:hypothetical protein
MRLLAAAKAGRWDEVDRSVAHDQSARKALGYAQGPIVGGFEGMAFGGGSEVAMHCAHRVLAHEKQNVPHCERPRFDRFSANAGRRQVAGMLSSRRSASSKRASG